MFKRRRPGFYGIIYLCNVAAFGVVYACLFADDFGVEGGLTPLLALYFSVVTVTTLGFGDITPSLNSTYLLIAVVAQVVAGVTTIGLFLNALSQKWSDIKDAQVRARYEEEEARRIARYLSILRPIIADHLKVLAECYKVTATEVGKRFRIRPRDMFTERYFDQVSLIDYYSDRTRFGKGRLLGEVLHEDNDRFRKDLEGYLAKFAHGLPVDTVQKISAMQRSQFLNYPSVSIQIYRLNKQMGVQTARQHIISLEHSSRAEPGHAKPMREYHALLQDVIDDIERYLPDDPMEVSIMLENHVAPPVGSAIAEPLKGRGG
ncbi:hypothetical protein CAI21_08930 [Alkalilimnicola ehrlichii]|uniref:Potassium channel domain-containing protein n=1 Tax=Alkalilimnicola ehrlichii TaxID=351052 RepID=A0A3E0WWZ8_9GAMM|nr:potassium channel family protein [Alkalilimnicola ehrlichii]RFA29936.1 hypothetical protein CAI21_08930 [Alkalilimnicola ehrlichii]RFA36525.1 hypothetical protein CAL65_11205 [Alkalilimnicola ehrlichii]